jgi:hypothetical protein
MPSTPNAAAYKYGLLRIEVPFKDPMKQVARVPG